MYTLAFDTTAACCSIALLKDDKISRTFEQEMDFGQAEVLMPEIKNLLAKERISFSDLNLVVVCIGPGSFTGVRSSISAARTFGLTSDKLAVAGVSAFEQINVFLQLFGIIFIKALHHIIKGTFGSVSQIKQHGQPP